MGGLVDSIFGGGSKKATKKSLAFMKQVYGENKAMAQPWADKGYGAYSAANDFLFGPNQSQAFNNWLNSSDYKFTTQAGLDAITQNMASKGLLNSGSTLKAITQWGQQNAQQYRQNYFNNLMGSAGLGAGVLGNLMGQSNQSAGMYGNTAQQGAQLAANGVGNFLNFGLGVAGLISDERLKTDKKRIGSIKTHGKVVPLHAYRYKGEPKNAQPHIGVMAQDVKRLVPKALGPKVGNFMSVDYKELLYA